MWKEIFKNILSRKKDIPYPEGFDIGDDERAAFDALGRSIDRIFRRSARIRQVDAGSCNACEWECTALINPLYDIQRLGIDFVASPRHADILLVTGPVARQMELALKKTYLATPEPKLVIALGDCAKDGGVYKGSYAVTNGVHNVIPVDCHIPGCPPTPAAIARGIADFLNAVAVGTTGK